MKSNKYLTRRDFLKTSALALGAVAVIPVAPAGLESVCAGEASVKSTIDAIVTRFYKTLDREALLSLTQEKILGLLTPEEKWALAHRECYFDVDVPVTVSVIRSSYQNPVPFWLEEAGFTNTGDRVTSVWYEHEVWQKDFPADRIGLGINGFDNERKAYFVCVAPKNPGDTLTISDLYPDKPVITVGEKNWTYADWRNLVWEEFPEYLKEQQLLTTFRGRGKGAHLIGAFRETPFPASAHPDQVVLTWSGDPKTTQCIQWRTDTSVQHGAVCLRDPRNGAYSVHHAELEVISDRMLMNDPDMHHFTVELTDLQPDTTYTYQVGDPVAKSWQAPSTFTSAPGRPDAPFTFMYTGDTHNSESWGALLEAAFEKHPDMGFYVIGGDQVSTGLNRVHWDQFLNYGKDVFNRKQLAFCLGNHDDQDGLGVDMILDMFRFPADGPEGVERGRMFTHRYGNAEFFFIDVGTELETVRDWLAEVLPASTATWKFFIYHFPLYGDGEDDYSHVSSLWAPLFDQYHVDFCLSGHFHRYFRTHPIRGGKVMDSPAEGTIYLHTAGVASNEPILGNFHLAAVHAGRAQLYQKFSIDGNRLTFQTFDIEGDVLDELVIEK